MQKSLERPLMATYSRNIPPVFAASSHSLLPWFPCADAGLGLWTTRFYPKSALITEYCGPIVSFQEARRLREAQQDSHIRVLSSFHECIDGIKEQQPGLGGASFANDARSSRRNNAAFTTRCVCQQLCAIAGRFQAAQHAACHARCVGL